MTDEWQAQISRRSLLTGAGSLALSSLLTGCSGQAANSLQILLLRGSIPPQLIGQFQQSLKRQKADGINLTVDSSQQLRDLFIQLQAWKRSPPPKTQPSFWDAITRWIPGLGGSQSVADLVTLGDFWLEVAIRQGLIAPLETASLQTWTTLAQIPQLQQLVTRNNQGQLDPKGQVWAAPYRLGTTVLAYRKDIFAQRNLQPPTDWSDLWREDLRRRSSLLDNPREVIGLTLKKLNQSYNTPDLSSVPTLKAELRALNQNTKFYSSTTYLQPLLLDDVWLSVAWSTDVLPLSQRSQQIGVVIPRSGTALFADLWVHPSINGMSLPNSASQWIDFCWQTDPATQLSLATWAVSPSLIGTPIAQLPEGFQAQPALLPDVTTFKQSEFLLPLSEATTKQYQQLWTEMRQG
ncbi:MAG: extracellular solute-binding protein [Leptolyngbyaceae cyanobacterium bins.302]|nr:extracellular solute-binding protein [Leptolyngbyaceae cyanobacterium bins.302]